MNIKKTSAVCLLCLFKPVTEAADCIPDSLQLSNHTYLSGEVAQIAAHNSLQFGGNVNVNNGADIALKSARITLTAPLTISQGATFTATPATALTPSSEQAIKFLRQASFGPTGSSIADVVCMGIDAWVGQQLATTSAYDSTLDSRRTYLERTIEIAKMSEPSRYPLTVEQYLNGTAIFNKDEASSRVFNYLNSTWFENALAQPDQVRQRMAYALSQIIVTSRSDSLLERRSEGLAYYYDLLARYAFGNYRDLLGDIARSPAMGIYLTHHGNKKADPETGTFPDENFAREIMQLFSIGLFQLHQDGSRILDGDLQPIASYSQNDIEELARVLTGWDNTFNNRYGDTSSNRGDLTQPMEFTAEHHDFGEKSLLGITIPANLSGPADLDAALNIIFNHPNVAPFIARQLIMRLVTSNPSPEYVGRVAAVFNNNGQGVRGDLKAVARAILLDPDARSNWSQNSHFGKAREPVLALAQFLRATNARPLDGWPGREEGAIMSGVYWFENQTGNIGQSPMAASSVFNFYSPSYVPPDNYLKTHQLATPELQIQSDQILINFSNHIRDLQNKFELNEILDDFFSVSEFASGLSRYSDEVILFDYDEEMQLLETVIDGDTNGDFININDNTVGSDGYTPKERGIRVLLDHLGLKLTANALSVEQKNIITTGLMSINFSSSKTADEARDIVHWAMRFIITSNAFMVMQ